MKQVEIDPKINSSILVGGEIPSDDIPFSDEFRALANQISSSLRASLDSDDISDIEAAGRQALAAMLTLYANGSLPPKQAFSFLKSLSERKTPDPVQKVEQHNVTDMRVLVQELIVANPGALEQTLAKAEEKQKAIKTRLELPESSFDLRAEQTNPGTHPLPSDTPPLPVEIDNIQAGRSPQEGIDGYKRFSGR